VKNSIRQYEVGETIPAGTLTGLNPGGLLRRYLPPRKIVGYANDDLKVGDIALVDEVAGVARVRRGIKHAFAPADTHPENCVSVRESGDGVCWYSKELHVGSGNSQEKTPQPAKPKSGLLQELEHRLHRQKVETEEKQRAYEVGAQKVRELEAAIKAIKELS
jgi:hypothetical protein